MLIAKMKHYSPAERMNISEHCTIESISSCKPAEDKCAFKNHSIVRYIRCVLYFVGILSCLLAVFVSGCVANQDYVHNEFIRKETIQRVQTVNVRTEPSGAKVYVDEQFVGKTPTNIPVKYADIYRITKKVTDRPDEAYHYAWSSNTKTYTRIAQGPEQRKLEHTENKKIKIEMFLDGYELHRTWITIPCKKSDYLFFLKPKAKSNSRASGQQQQQQTVIIEP